MTFDVHTAASPSDTTTTIVRVEADSERGAFRKVKAELPEGAVIRATIQIHDATVRLYGND